MPDILGTSESLKRIAEIIEVATQRAGSRKGHIDVSVLQELNVPDVAEIYALAKRKPADWRG